MTGAEPAERDYQRFNELLAIQLDYVTLVGGQTAALTYYSSRSASANGNFLKTITWSPGPSWGIGYDKGLPKTATNDLGLILSFT